MAGYNLPENVVSGGTGHITHTNAVHDIVNKFDKDATPATGQLLRFNGTVFVPYTLTIDDLPAGVGVVVLASSPTRPTNDAGRIVIAVGGATPPSWGLTNDVHIASA